MLLLLLSVLSSQTVSMKMIPVGYKKPINKGCRDDYAICNIVKNLPLCGSHYVKVVLCPKSCGDCSEFQESVLVPIKESEFPLAKDQPLLEVVLESSTKVSLRDDFF